MTLPDPENPTAATRQAAAIRATSFIGASIAEETDPRVVRRPPGWKSRHSDTIRASCRVHRLPPVHERTRHATRDPSAPERPGPDHRRTLVSDGRDRADRRATRRPAGHPTAHSTSSAARLVRLRTDRAVLRD